MSFSIALTSSLSRCNLASSFGASITNSGSDDSSASSFSSTFAIIPDEEDVTPNSTNLSISPRAESTVSESTLCASPKTDAITSAARGLITLSFDLPTGGNSDGGCSDLAGLGLIENATGVRKTIIQIMIIS